MKTKTIVLCLAAIISISVAIAVGAENKKAESVVVTLSEGSSERANAIIKNADTQLEVSAANINVEEGSGGVISIVRCSGEVTIRSGARTIQGKDITIKMGAGDTLKISTAGASTPQK